MTDSNQRMVQIDTLTLDEINQALTQVCVWLSPMTPTTQLTLWDAQAPPHRWELTVDSTGALITTDVGV